ncbi:hypothetical protein [Streptomyces rhizosphaericus]|uniref:Uncharacterized protein n=1 Tax=Streptomyces rhizosphaericus TaxID=114699 RepID=A0ABN1SSD1_9ACTN
MVTITVVDQVEVQEIETAPLVGADQWRTVMAAADYRCECTGACGNRHSRTGLRCDATHDKWTKATGRIRLTAGPIDPITPTRTAVLLPASDLRAWCPKCFAGAARRARAAATERERRNDDANEAQGALF